jgi:dodecin
LTSAGGRRYFDSSKGGVRPQNKAIIKGKDRQRRVGIAEYILPSQESCDSSRQKERRLIMPNSTYIIEELIGTSETSWEDAAKNAIECAAARLKDIRIAEIVKLDTVIEEGKVKAFRARISLSLKYDPEIKNPGLDAYTSRKL